MLLLHEVSLIICPELPASQRSRFALLTAILHIISPAGIFLSAPYAESSFSLLNFTGFYLYAHAILKHQVNEVVARDFFTLSAGICFGIATIFRGNGLFSGLILVYDATTSAIDIVRSPDTKGHIRRFVFVITSGASMACIVMVPQYLAYSEYCRSMDAEVERRPWCSYWLPSVYTWVQKHYWYVS